MTEIDATKEWTWNRSDELAVAEGCYFSMKHGKDVCDFIERFCCLSQGRWAGKRIQLIPWQRSFLMRLFGWRRADGKRRFRRAFLMVAKKQGKSPLMSAIALYLLLADGEQAPEIYLCACDRDQAGIVYTEAERMIQYSPTLQKRVEVIPSRKTILSGHGKIVTNSSDAPKLDGLNASAVLVDELHRQPNRLLWDVMKYAVAAREQPLTLAATTAGESEDDQEIWFEELTYGQQVEAGIVHDSSFLSVIYRADETDDIDDPETALKANPSLGITFMYEDFKRDLDEAKNSPAKLANFKRLRLNIVCRGENQFLNLEDWDVCNGWPEIDADTPNFLGIDLSSRDDLSALCMLSGNFTEGFRAAMLFWLPQHGIERLERQHQVPYREWSKKGLITLTPGNAVDYDFIEKAIVDIAAAWNVLKIGTDAWNAQKLAGSLLNKHSLPVQYVRQGFATLTDPTKTLLELVRSRRFAHGGHPILRWHASNATAVQDPSGNIKLSKAKKNKKIDGLAAVINALACATDYFGNEPEACVYDTPGQLAL